MTGRLIQRVVIHDIYSTRYLHTVLIVIEARTLIESSQNWCLAIDIGNDPIKNQACNVIKFVEI